MNAKLCSDAFFFLYKLKQCGCMSTVHILSVLGPDKKEESNDSERRDNNSLEVV